MVYKQYITFTVFTVIILFYCILFSHILWIFLLIFFCQFLIQASIFIQNVTTSDACILMQMFSLRLQDRHGSGGTSDAALAAVVK